MDLLLQTLKGLVSRLQPLRFWPQSSAAVRQSHARRKKLFFWLLSACVRRAQLLIITLYTVAVLFALALPLLLQPTKVEETAFLAGAADSTLL